MSAIHWNFGCLLAAGWIWGISNITRDAQLAHGLSGSLEAPDWPPLTLPEVDALLRRYPQAGGAEELLSFSPRPFSAASVVATPMGKVFVKRHHRSVRDREGLLEEHRLIAHLAEAMRDTTQDSIPFVQLVQIVQPVLANRNGETVATSGEWTYEVHPLAEGVDVYEQALSWTPFLCAGHARAAGLALARLHRAARSYEVPARKTQQLVSSFTIFAGGAPSERMESYLESRPLLREYVKQRDWQASLDRLLMPFYWKLEPWLSYLPPLWTHNDFHASNMTWRVSSNSSCEDAEVAGVIDFGLADRTNAVHDLATAIERNIVEWLRIQDPGADVVHLDHLDAFLAGYEELSPLSYEEARALAAMLPLMHCEFALSETDYFLSILRSPEKAFLAYEGYFLGHAAWFRSPDGRRLLNHLERWAENRPSDGGGR
ncbi:phosphotransferase enzyme family protein [Acidicapsa acidisoli]|uniref:phosphotransferase enzyme family protein n=1 Tax=Acidicapsa acidisoli TaxID=1615681 RepID=UPI0021E01556|nr:phosphotransferase [Acidicapsa acidisoli]